MNIIYQRTGARYHEVNIYRLLHKWGFRPKVPQRRFIDIAPKEEKEQFKKKIISNIPKGFIIVVEDELICIRT